MAELTLTDFWDGEDIDAVNYAAWIGTDRDRAAPGSVDATMWSGINPPYGSDIGLLLQTPYTRDAIRAEHERALAIVGLDGSVAINGETGDVLVQTATINITTPGVFRG